MAQPTLHCDPETGLCTLPELPVGEATSTAWRDDLSIIYVGDPLCSWCWGISPALQQLRLRAAEEGIPFRIVLGGLRPGGGDEWNQQFQDFLRHHWEEVSSRSGQPFTYDLLEMDYFNYDTEPACRAIVAARSLAPAQEHRFFELVQHHFYVRNQDPGEVSFYAPICAELGIDFTAFAAAFASDTIREATLADFQRSRQWGVRGFPTVLLQQGSQLQLLASGYTTFEVLWGQVEQAF
jgi:putative protein-disulfide isomerase